MRAATSIPGYPAAATSGERHAERRSSSLHPADRVPLLMAGMGLWIGRRVRATGDFFVAGRSLGPALISRRFSPETSAPGRPSAPRRSAIATGWSAWWWNASAGIGCLVLAFTVGPRMWRESRPTAISPSAISSSALRPRHARARRAARLGGHPLDPRRPTARHVHGVQVAAGLSKFAGCA